jgi:hypothetical protein
MARSPRTPFFCPAWFVEAAELMARSGSALREASIEVGHELDVDEAKRVFARREFQEILRREKNKYYQAVANDPARTKSSILGRLSVIADRLISEGELEKAANVLDKLAKVEGWTGSESNVNVFAGLTAKDLAEAKERILSGWTPNSPSTNSNDSVEKNN